jgi:hypothetical protein
MPIDNIPLAMPIKYDPYAGFVSAYDSNEKADQSDLLYWIADNPIAENPLLTSGALAGALAIPGAKEVYKGARAEGKGVLRSGAGVALKGLGRAFSPLPVAVIEAADIGSDVAKDKDLKERLTSPFSYMNLAFLENLAPSVARPAGALNKVKDYFTLANVGTKAEPGILSAALRMGLNPRTIAAVSRYAGIPGLIASTAYTGWDMFGRDLYDKYVGKND